MQTIVVDDEVHWVQCGPVPGFVATPIRDSLREPIPPEAQCYDFRGRPCLLFAMWDYAEDWSGEYVRELHPFAVSIWGRVIDEDWWRERVALCQRGRQASEGN